MSSTIVRLLLVLDKSQAFCQYQQMLQYQIHFLICLDSMRQTVKQNSIKRTSTYILPVFLVKVGLTAHEGKATVKEFLVTL